MRVAVDVSDAETVKAVNAEWLTEVLSKQYPGVEVTSAELIDVIQGAFVKLRLHVQYNRAGEEAQLPPSLIVKGWFGRHNPAWSIPAVFNELNAYKEIVAQTEVNAPKVYYAGEDPDGFPAVVMEDLLLRDVRINFSTKPLTYQEAEDLVSGMARLHARWWEPTGERDLAMWGDMEPVYHGGSLGNFLERMLIPSVWAEYMELPRAAGLPEQFKDPELMLRALHAAVEAYDNDPVTALHGDLHVGNTYQNPNGTGGFLDWTVRRGSWRHDFSFFLPNALDIPNRRKWEQPLLRHYLKQLSVHGVAAPPSYDDAWLAYRQGILHGMLVWMANGDDRGQFQQEPINTSGAVKHAWAVLDHDTVGLLV
jgi:hypothetical protein